MNKKKLLQLQQEHRQNGCCCRCNYQLDYEPTNRQQSNFRGDTAAAVTLRNVWRLQGKGDEKRKGLTKQNTVVLVSGFEGRRQQQQN